MSTRNVPHPLLAKYLEQLAAHPLRTKAVTTGILCFLQEVLGSNLAKMPVKKQPKDAPAIQHLLARSHVDIKAVKMAIYGFLVSAPMSHYAIGALTKAFEGKTGLGAKIGQILASNLLIAPVQTAAYLACMAIIGGAKTVDEVVKTVKSGFFSVLRFAWTVSPLSMVIAQKYIPVEMWVLFFNTVNFVLGTYFNMRIKQLRKAAAKREEKEAEKDKGSNA